MGETKNHRNIVKKKGMSKGTIIYSNDMFVIAEAHVKKLIPPLVLFRQDVFFWPARKCCG